jgi:RNA polymerase sigma factor (sigma-70 family)
MELSDAELVRRCRAGDAAGWALIVERFSRYVHAVVVQAFGLRDQDAEDVYQEVFAKAYENLGQLRDDSAFRPWIAQLTRRACIDRLRAAPREQAAADELEPRDVDETIRPRRELSHDRGGAGHPGWDGREPDISLPRPSGS